MFADFGDEYALDQLLEDKGLSSFNNLPQIEVAAVVEALDKRLGYNITNPPEERIKEQRGVEGQEGSRSQYGGVMEVIQTDLPNICLHLTCLFNEQGELTDPIYGLGYYPKED